MNFNFLLSTVTCRQCFEKVGWTAGRAPGLQKYKQVMRCWCGYLSGGADCLHMVPLMSLPSPDPSLPHKNEE